MKFQFILCFIFLLKHSVSQDSVADNKVKGFGRSWGVAVENKTRLFSGIRFSFSDFGCVTNGINFSVISEEWSSPARSYYSTNGINFSLFETSMNRVNGIDFSLFMGETDKLNGVGFGGFLADVYNVNGVYVALLGLNERMNGVFLSAFHTISFDLNGLAISGLGYRIDNLLNGIGISGIGFSTEKFNGMIASLFTTTIKGNGLQIGLVNKADHLNGFQFGGINIIKENPRWLRCLPGINFNFNFYLPKTDTAFSPSDSTFILTAHNPNRTVKSVEKYKDGEKTGWAYFYNEKGKLISKKYYHNLKNGQIVLELDTGKKITGIEQSGPLFEKKYNNPKNNNLINQEIDQYPSHFHLDFEGRLWLYKLYDIDTLNLSVDGVNQGKWENKDVESLEKRWFYFQNDSLLSFVRVYDGPDLNLKLPGKVSLKYKKGDTINGLDSIYYFMKLFKRNQILISLKRAALFLNQDGSISSAYFNIPLDSIPNHSGEIRFPVKNYSQYYFKNGNLRMDSDNGSFERSFFENGILREEKYYWPDSLYCYRLMNIYNENGTLRIKKDWANFKTIYYSKDSTIKRIRRIRKKPQCDHSEELYEDAIKIKD